MDSRGGLRENDERGTERPSLRPVLTTGEGNGIHSAVAFLLFRAESERFGSGRRKRAAKL